MKKLLYVFVCLFYGIFFPLKLHAQLHANFSATPINGCSPILVQFNDLSTGSPTSWTWNLGNGTFSSQQNPSTVYVTPGTYNVTLTVSNGVSTDSIVFSNFITVIPSPDVYFVVNDSSITCPPKTVQFTNLSTLGSSGTGSYLWDFGDGASSTLQNPTHTYTSGGNYNVTLSVTNSNGCQKLMTKTNYIQVSPPPVADFISSNNNSCIIPTTVNFTNTTIGGFTYAWTFGSSPNSTQINPTHTYNVAGSYNVTLIATNPYGCSDTVIKPNFVNIGPITVAFTKSASTVCKNIPINFTNTTTPGVGSCVWDFGDGTTSTLTNASHLYSTAGIFTVKLVVINGICKDSTTQTVTILPSPTASFTASPTTSCIVPQTVQFTNNSTGGSSYVWSFGTGPTSNQINPTFTYNSLGAYNVALIAISGNGCKDTLTQYSYINILSPSISVFASNTNGCLPDTVVLTATSSPASNSYTWNLGNGNIINGTSSLTYIYNSPGIYNITASIAAPFGCSITSTPITINVGNPPIPSFTASPNPTCSGTPISFTNTSISASGTTYIWNFGDGGIDSVSDPIYGYSNQGVYTVMLTATNQGCSAIYTANITITPPAANFIVTPGSCTNKLNITTTNTSTPGCIYSWNFGDGTTSSSTNPTHTYSTYGNYVVVLHVTNPISGCVAHLSRNLKLYELTGDFIATDTAMCNHKLDSFFVFIDSATKSSILSYKWYFGDGSTYVDNDSFTTHTYTTSGIFTVKLVLTDSSGCSDTIIKTNYIHVGGPTVDFIGIPTIGCKPLTVNFTDQTISPDGFASRNWKFGDGGISNLNSINISHTYIANGNYSVRLIVTDFKGCKDTLVKNNYINVSKPTALYTSPLPNNSVTFVGFTPELTSFVFTCSALLWLNSRLYSSVAKKSA